MSHDYSLDNTCIPLPLGSSSWDWAQNSSKLGGDCAPLFTLDTAWKKRTTERRIPQRENTVEAQDARVFNLLCHHRETTLLFCTVAWSWTYLYHRCASWEVVTARALPKGQSHCQSLSVTISHHQWREGLWELEGHQRACKSLSDHSGLRWANRHEVLHHLFSVHRSLGPAPGPRKRNGFFE